jgi:TetR/AcrR family transcriptional regulator, repressor for uid operon
MRTTDPALHERRRDEILSAAGQCFVEKGFHQASMADIARAAGLSMGLLYRYFKNKAAIVTLFSARDRDAALDLIKAFGASANPLDQLPALVEQLTAQAMDIHFARITGEVLAEAGRNQTLLLAIQADDLALRSALTQCLRTQQKTGAITKRMEPRELTNMLMTLFDGLLGRSICDAQLDLRKFRQSLVSTLRHLLRP